MFAYTCEYLQHGGMVLRSVTSLHLMYTDVGRRVEWQRRCSKHRGLHYQLRAHQNL